MESHVKRIKIKKKNLVSSRRVLQSDFFKLKLICNVVSDLYVQQSDSVIYMCVYIYIYMKICIHFHILFHYNLS